MLYSPILLVDSVISPVLTYIGRDNKSLCLFLGALSSCQPEATEPSDYGCYDISHEQHWGCWDNYLYLQPAFASKVRGLASQHRFLEAPDLELSFNFGYATAIAALIIEQHLNQDENVQGKGLQEYLTAWQASGGHISIAQAEKHFHELKQYYDLKAA